jgi:hypothetical protein
MPFAFLAAAIFFTPSGMRVKLRVTVLSAESAEQQEESFDAHT